MNFLYNYVGDFYDEFWSKDLIIKDFESENIDYEIVQIGKNPIAGCIGCASCRKTGECFRKDIANEIANVFSIEVQKIYKLNNVSVVDKAVDSVKPFNVNYFKDNVIYAGIAIMLSCGIIFIKFYFDTTIKTGEEIENKLGLTILGIVPKVEKE